MSGGWGLLCVHGALPQSPEPEGRLGTLAAHHATMLLTTGPAPVSEEPIDPPASCQQPAVDHSAAPSPQGLIRTSTELRGRHLIKRGLIKNLSS